MLPIAFSLQAVLVGNSRSLIELPSLLALGAIVILLGCSESEKDSPDGLTSPEEVRQRQEQRILRERNDAEYCEFLARLGALESEEQKWALFRRFYHKIPSESFDDWLRDMVAGCSSSSDDWLEYYPALAYRIRWDVDMIRTLGQRLDWRERKYWSGPWGGRSFTRRTLREMAQRWLSLITDRHFDSEKDLQQWIDAAGDRLRWDPVSRRMVIDPITTRPADPGFTGDSGR